MMIGMHVNRNYITNDDGNRASIVKHIDTAISDVMDGHAIQVKCVAIFVGGPRSKEITLHDSESIELRNYIKNKNIAVIAHSAYCAPPWNGSKSSMRYIESELSTCRAAGIIGLVIHLPKQSSDVVMEYIPRLNVIASKHRVRIYFEIPAIVRADAHYNTPEKLMELYMKIRTVDHNLDNFGLCIDTAHLWVSGIDLRYYDDADDWIKGILPSVIEPSKIMLHLNDSKRELGNGPDEHDALCSGNIWKGQEENIKKSGLSAFIDFARRNNMITILERRPKESLEKDFTILRLLWPTS